MIKISMLYSVSENPCLSNPCQNGGQCAPASDYSSFSCACPPSFAGDYCQTGSVTAETKCTTELHFSHSLKKVTHPLIQIVYSLYPKQNTGYSYSHRTV